MVRMWLVREYDDPADKNAVMVIAYVIGKGAAKIGYLKTTTAAVLAGVIDKAGGKMQARLEAVTKNSKGVYGAVISFSLNGTGMAA